MTDSPDGTESVGAESGEDGQLTIRIPNPKVYMARQSQWKGRRGKPRCDHCRLNNLKVSSVVLYKLCSRDSGAHVVPLASAIVFCRLVITVLGVPGVNASIHRCPLLHTGVSRGVTGVDSRTSKYAMVYFGCIQSSEH